MYNLTELKNDTARKEFIRSETNRIIYCALVKEFGVENVVMLDKAMTSENGTDFSKGTVIFNAGEVKDKDGFEVCAIGKVSTVSVSWNNTGKRKQIKAETWGDILTMVDLYNSKDEEKG